MTPHGRATGAPARPRAAVLSFSPIARDARVARSCDLLAGAGFDVALLAEGEARDAPASAAFVPLRPRPAGLAGRADAALRQGPSLLAPALAAPGYWAAPRHRDALARLRALAPDLVLAHDWPALVAGAALKRATGARLAYDAHEFAAEEFAERLGWRLLYRPYVTALERGAIGAADLVVTVAPGIAEALRERYALPAPPLVARSTPPFEPPPERPAAWPMTVLYHGLLHPNRGLEALVESAALWRVPHRLVLRGYGAPAYERSLRALIAARGLAGRVALEPAVARDAVVRAAGAADLGAFVTPLETAQQRFVLPNKLFEYLMAGLPLLVSPAPEMGRLVADTGAGVVTMGWTPAAIAAAVDGLDPTLIDGLRARARIAASELCWEREGAPLRAALEALTAT